MIRVERAKDRILIEKVVREGQGHVFRWWNELSEPSRRKLLGQLESIDFKLLHTLQEQCSRIVKKNEGPLIMDPPEVISLPRTEDEMRMQEKAKEIGEKVIRAGRVAAFLVAGGQGTRLGFKGPKGCFPVGPVTGKSLYQMLAEKILAARQAYGIAIPWYVMTSATNHEETSRYFKKHAFFGLQKKDVSIFQQRMIPALDERGKLVLDEKDHIFMNPNGHGGSLLALLESGALDDMKRRGVDVISYFQVDNPLNKIIDPIFIGYHEERRSDMSSKMVRKKDPMEKMGVFGQKGGKLKVIEYSDMTTEDMEARRKDGSLKYEAGSIATHLINVAFAEREVRGGFTLPYHVAHKKIPCLNEKGERIIPQKPNGYKFETFIFDIMSDLDRWMIMEVDRAEEVSPIKNPEGEASPESARKAISNFYGQWLEAAGIFVPRDAQGNVKGLIEISPLFAMDKPSLIKKVDSHLRFDGSLYLGPV